MKYLDFRETVQHGTFDFPIALYKIDPLHPQYDMMYHWHPECEIIRIKKGRFLISLDSSEKVAEKGDIIYITDGVMHAGHAVEECEYECVVFDAKGVMYGNHAGVRRMENVISHKRVINSHFKNIDSELNNIINSLFDAMDRRYSGYEFTVTGALMQFYGYVFKNHLYSANPGQELKPKEQQLMMRDVVSFIEMNYAEKISLGSLAKMAGMNPKYFCSVFYKITRKTPIEYLNAYRIECACEKLITTDRSVTEIAFSCGFNDLSYFTKTFKKYKNTTPLRYRRSDVAIV